MDETYEDIEARLIRDGFTPYYNHDDERAATSKPCEECGEDMMYAGWKKDRLYVAYAVCTGCGDTIEF